MVVIDKEVGRIKLKLQAVKMGEDLCVIITGGKEHIGAITFSYDKEASTVAFGTHKENFVTQAVGNILKDKYCGNFVICCGIHFDNITKEEIECVKTLSFKITEELCLKLRYR